VVLLNDLPHRRSEKRKLFRSRAPGKAACVAIHLGGKSLSNESRERAVPVSSLDISPAAGLDAYIVAPEVLATLSPKLNRLESEFDDRSVRDRSVQDRYRAEVCSLLGNEAQSISKYIDERLRRAPHWALVKGFPPQFARSFLVGLTAALGTLEVCHANPGPRAVREVRPATDTRFASAGVLNESLHTDSSDWPNPNDLTCLFCVRPDQFGGGATRLLSIEDLFSALRRSDSGAAALSFLQNTKVPWRGAPEFGGDIFEDFVFQGSRLRWMRLVIQEKIGGSLEKTLRAALDEVERAIEGFPKCEHFFMQSGDLLIVDNKRCLHARASVPFEEQSQRLVLRTKIRLHEAETGAPSPTRRPAR
jgi:hypothetical protein